MCATGCFLALVFAVSAQAGPGGDAYRGAETNLLAKVRAEFAAAPESAAATDRIIQLLDGTLPAAAGGWPPIFRAYRAALEGLAGKHSLRPWSQYQRAKAGLARFHGLVEAHPESIEIRMLRYSFCSQLPGFFDMRPQAEADLAALADLFDRNADPGVDAAYRRGAIRWILRNGAPSPEQRRRLEAVLSTAGAEPAESGKIGLSPPRGGE